MFAKVTQGHRCGCVSWVEVDCGGELGHTVDCDGEVAYGAELQFLRQSSQDQDDGFTYSANDTCDCQYQHIFPAG